MQQRVRQCALLIRSLVAAQQDARLGARIQHVAADRFGVRMRSVNHPARTVLAKPGHHFRLFQTTAAHLPLNIPRQRFPRGGSYRYGVAHLCGIQLQTKRARIAGAADHQHVAKTHST